MGKEKSLSKLKAYILKSKKLNKKIVFTNGCFDLIHPGHIKILKEAKTKGDILVVGLNADSSIKKIKGPKRPILKQKERLQILESLEFVDIVIIFKETTPYNIIKAIKPDILVKGGDWAKNKIIGHNLVSKIHRVKISPGHSTTAIINKIKNA